MKLIKILPNKIQIKTDDFEFSDAKLNDLIKISDADTALITMIVSMTNSDDFDPLGEDENIEIPQSVKVIECSIIGSLKDGKFRKAINEYPTTNITASQVSPDAFKNMIGTDHEKGFCIGKYVGYECDAYVDGNKFFQRHSCIVGNTGAGKSETVARILEQVSSLPGANVIVFDIHGEYRELSYARNIQISNKRPFPIWMFGFTDMVSNILKIKEESATVAMTALRKCYHKVCPGEKENRPVYFNYMELVKLMKFLNEQMVDTGEVYKSGERAGQAKVTKGDYTGKLTNIVNLLVDKMADSKYRFLFEDMPQQYLFDFIDEIMKNDVPVKNIDLSEVPHDVAISIIGAVTKLVYEIQRAYKVSEVHPITLVCDEAHVYIPDIFQLSASQQRMVETFENIAKEGRKFGITLFVASQRPSELNKTIMAQCANFIVGKLNNENDKSMIKGMLPDGSREVIDSVTMFLPGDVLIVGDAVPIPLKVHVKLAEERPQSRTIDFWDKWKNPNVVSIETAASRYMIG